jgi:hypothetical protein
MPYFSTLSRTQHYFREKVVGHKMCFKFFCNFLSATHLILRRINRYIIKLHRYPCKVPLFLSDCNGRIIEKLSYVKFNEILPNGSSVFHADGRTEMRKIIVALRNFADSPNVPVFNGNIVSTCSSFGSRLHRNLLSSPYESSGPRTFL